MSIFWTNVEPEPYEDLIEEPGEFYEWNCLWQLERELMEDQPNGTISQ